MITVIGTITWEDGTPIEGATISSPGGSSSQGGTQTSSLSDGSYSLTYQLRCTPGGFAFNVNVQVPVANNGGSCTGVPTCSVGPHRRDCVFDLPG